MIDRPRNISHMIRMLRQFWRDHGCSDLLPLNSFAGAATFHPQCILGTLNDRTLNVVYLGNGLRHDDRTGGTSPHRNIQHIQLQVLWKSPPNDVLNLYRKSLISIGIDVHQRHMRYLDSSWETKSFGGFGRGLEISCDLLEITQFTYFTRMCDVELKQIPVEITYGVERLALILWPEYNHIDNIPWSETMTYGEMRLYEERDRSNAIDLISLSKQHIEEQLRAVDVLLNNGNVFGTFYRLLDIANYFNELDAQRGLNHIDKIQCIDKIRRSVNRMGILYQESVKN